MRRRWLYRTHVIIGMIAGGWIAWMAITGIGLALGPMILAWAETPPVVTTHSGLPFQTWHPSGGSRLTIFSSPSSAVLLGKGSDQPGAWLNPYTGQLIRTESNWPRWIHRLETWHRWMGLEGTPRQVVRWVKAMACVGLIGLVITGIWQVRQRRGRPLPSIPWHSRLGIWASPMLVMMALTGLVLSTESIKKPVKHSQDIPSTFPIPSVMNQLKQQYPNWDRVVIKWGDSVTTLVYCGPWTRYQLEWDDTGKWIKTTPRTNWPKLLHTGQLLGMFGSMVALMGGVATLILVVSGTQLVIQRWRNRV